MYLVRIPYCATCHVKAHSLNVMFSEQPVKTSFGKGSCCFCSSPMQGTSPASQELPSKEALDILGLVSSGELFVEDFGVQEAQFAGQYRVAEDEDWVKARFRSYREWRVTFAWSGELAGSAPSAKPNLNEVPYGIVSLAQRFIKDGFVVTQLSNGQESGWMYLERNYPEGALPERCRRVRISINWPTR
ncbi:MAG TPA: hypothetical protein V6C81_11990 [Planktothrix sp.]|jgi:hypothetical protein